MDYSPVAMWRYTETMTWQQQLTYNPIPPLLQTDNRAIVFFAERDLLGIKKDYDQLWQEHAVLRLVHRQRSDGSWKYPNSNQSIRSQTNYDQLETFRNLGILIAKYNLDNRHAAIAKAAEFLFSFQTPEGDFRGLYGKQYATPYSAAISELLVKAGYNNDQRVIRSLEWLMSVRQNDGGWAIPFRTRQHNLAAIQETKTIQPDRTKPYSHLVTGMALRALVAHSHYRHHPDIIAAGKLLSHRFFKRDKYPDRQAVSFWTEFPYPFWYTDLLSSLDSLAKIGLSPDDPEIKRALSWFVEQQTNSGLWNLRTHMNKDKDLGYWLSLSVCRVFSSFYST